MANVIGIVGAEAAKFTLLGQARARKAIDAAITCHEPEGVSSGRCHLGGVDVWAEEIAKERGCYREELIYPAKVRQWSGEGGYAQRNIRIALVSRVLVCIVVDKLPLGYKGVDYGECYHCKRPSRMKLHHYIPHVKSGGCWTMWCAREVLKRPMELVVINNYE